MEEKREKGSMESWVLMGSSSHRIFSSGSTIKLLLVKCPYRGSLPFGLYRGRRKPDDGDSRPQGMPKGCSCTSVSTSPLSPAPPTYLFHRHLLSIIQTSIRIPAGSRHPETLEIDAGLSLSLSSRSAYNSRGMGSRDQGRLGHGDSTRDLVRSGAPQRHAKGGKALRPSPFLTDPFIYANGARYYRRIGKRRPGMVGVPPPRCVGILAGRLAATAALEADVPCLSWG